MVAAPAAADAVRRARALPSLRVGLHLVVIEGHAILPHAQIPDLVAPTGRFASDQFRRGLAYFANPTVRRQLAAEIEAQFAAFAATGLPLAHADAHKHMHLHPTVGALMIRSGQRHGLTRLRVPAEPPAILRACATSPTLAAHALHQWARVLRRQARRAGLSTPNHVFGLAWTGHMTIDRILALLPHIPPGDTEIYLHPATHQDATLAALMPSYDPAAEFAALCDPRLRQLHPL
jgi:hopanoid biosynthesis associated protein HpnK